MQAKKITWIIFVLILGTAVFWWTTMKNRVVKNAITKVVQKKTDSLYRITYDTATIDEVGGNAYLYNVKITLDSIEWLKLVQKDSMPPVTIGLSIAKVTIQGLKELKLLSNRSLDVSAIILDRPVFRMEKWARKRMPAEGLNDTLEVYKRLTGNFDFLRAKNIQVINGDVTLLNYLHKDSIAIKGIGVSIDDFLVDSAHDYHNIISYFISQTKATVNSFDNTALHTGRVAYDSKKHLLSVKDLSLKNKANPGVIKSIDVEGLSAEAYIYKNEINARKILVNQPAITIPPADPKNKHALLPAGFIDSLVIQKGKFIIRSAGKGSVLINDADVVLKKVTTLKGVLQIGSILNPRDCRFLIGYVQLPMGLHSMQLNQISYPGSSDILTIRSMQIKPTITRQYLKTKIGKQTDLYTVTASNILLDHFALKKVLKDTISIASVNLQVNLHVFDDKTLPVDSAKKGRGLFPFDKLRMAKSVIDIRSLYVTYSGIVYEEQAPKSQLNGFVRFTDLTGKVTNITNIPAMIAKNPMIHIEARAKVMGEAPLVSYWSIPLNKSNGSFRVTGKVGAFHVPILNPAFEPLSMTSIRSGEAEELNFEINGDHQGSTGNVLINYRDLKIDLLRKNDNDSLEKKGFLSLLANADVRNKNHSDKGKDFRFKKDRYKSFFNLLWKSVFQGAKETVLIVK